VICWWNRFIDVHSSEAGRMPIPEKQMSVNDLKQMMGNYYGISRSPIQSELMQAARNDFLRNSPRRISVFSESTEGEEMTTQSISNNRGVDHPVTRFCDEQDVMFLPQ
jgi:hypothetical protein